MARNWIAIAALLGFLGVGAGAFGAHGLRGRLSADSLAVYEVAVRYQMYHALGLFGLAWVSMQFPSRMLSAAKVLMLVGTILFCGSLYGLSLTEPEGGSSLRRWLGPVTPLGGVFLMGGWLLLGIGVLESGRGEKVGN